MVKKKKKVWVIVIAIALFSPFVFLSTSRKAWEGKDSLKYIAQEIIYPFEYVCVYFGKGISNLVSNYIKLTGVSKENKKLKEKLNLYEVKLTSYEEQTLELERLREELSFVKRYKREIIPSEVVSSPSYLPFQSMRITNGKAKNIEVGMPVITQNGIVGRIVRTGKYYSDVQLLTDPNFSVDILLQRTRVRGILFGNAQLKCILNLNRKIDIKIGDTVITSGIVGSFPKGIPVGQVKKISYSEDNISQEVTVEPWIDYQRLEEVFVILENDKDFQKISEIAGDEWIDNQLDKFKDK